MDKQEIIQCLRGTGYTRHFQITADVINAVPKSNIKVLDIGGDAKSLQAFLKDSIDYETLDYIEGSDYVVDLDKVERLPIEDEIYDVIVCLETLEHICYPRKVMKEIRRILKPDGLFIGSMPNEYNLYRRLLYLFAITSKVNQPFDVVSDHQHIHNPRVKDIKDFFDEYIDVDNYRYVWHSRSFLLIDWVMNILAPIYPSFFTRIVMVIGRKHLVAQGVKMDKEKFIKSKD